MSSSETKRRRLVQVCLLDLFLTVSYRKCQHLLYNPYSHFTYFTCPYFSRVFAHSAASNLIPCAIENATRPAA